MPEVRRPHPDDIPPVLLKGAIALVIGAVALVVFARATGLGVQTPDAPTIAAEQLLVFRDGTAGAIEAVDPASGEIAHVFAAPNGFVRTALRALAYDRRIVGVGGETPVRVILSEAGALYLEDPATGVRIALAAFGDDNEAAFAPLFETRRADSPADRRPS